MNKADLVQAVAQGTGLTRHEVSAVLEGVLEVISDELARKGRLEIRGFGTFRTEDRAEREAVNPHTGERFTVPAKTVPVFRASDKLKARVEASS
jgi:DNA-binding protein HU-beta